MRHRQIQLFVKKRGGAAPLAVAAAGSAVVPLAKTLLVKSLPYAKKAAIKAAPHLIPIVSKKIQKKLGMKKKKGEKNKMAKTAERAIISQIQAGLPIINQVKKTAYNRRKITQALINSL